MKACVQYNDYLGTAAADISDHINLRDYLTQKGVDTDRYEPIGAEFYHGERFFNASIICIDSQSETPDKAVKFGFEKGLTEEEINSFPKGYLLVQIAKKMHLLK